MIDSGLISPQNAILQLEKVIGIERRRDFAESNVGISQSDQIHSNALIMSEYAEEALDQIKYQLGYLPRRDVTWPSEPAIRQALFDFDNNHGNIDKLFDRCSLHIDEIYYRDMQPHAVKDYPKEVYELYDTLFPELKEVAQTRILKFADTKPELNFPVYAELLLRCSIIKNNFAFQEIRTDVDYETQGIIWFRQN